MVSTTKSSSYMLYSMGSAFLVLRNNIFLRRCVGTVLLLKSVQPFGYKLGMSTEIDSCVESIAGNVKTESRIKTASLPHNTF